MKLRTTQATSTKVSTKRIRLEALSFSAGFGATADFLGARREVDDSIGRLFRAAAKRSRPGWHLSVRPLCACRNGRQTTAGDQAARRAVRGRARPIDQSQL